MKRRMMAWMAWLSGVELLLLIFFVKKAYAVYQRVCHISYAFDWEERMIFLCKRYIKNRDLIRNYMRAFPMERVAVYGVGKVYEVFGKDLETDLQVKYYIDKYSERKRIDGKRIVRPEEICSMEPVDGILVTSVGFYEEIKKELQEKYEVKIPILDLEAVLNFEPEKYLQGGEEYGARGI